MKAWVIPTILFFVGVGLGVSGPTLATRYMEPYLPGFLKKPLHPLEGSVVHKQRNQDRLLITVKTQDGTILATFRKQIPEIDLLVEEQDIITLDVQHYEPFLNDPPVLKVHKQEVKDSQTELSPSPQAGSTPLSQPDLNPLPSTAQPSEKIEDVSPSTN